LETGEKVVIVDFFKESLYELKDILAKLQDCTQATRQLKNVQKL
jgi:hypothetical protein